MSWPAAFAVVEGTGAPERKKRGPICWPAGIAPPGLMSGFVPVRAVFPPLDASDAYWMAAPASA